MLMHGTLWCCESMLHTWTSNLGDRLQCGSVMSSSDHERNSVGHWVPVERDLVRGVKRQTEDLS
jgi:hypothetical protein